MKQVWKCEFCSHTQEKINGLIGHEEKCSFNPKNKKCFTCRLAWDSGHEYSIPECENHLSTVEGREVGNCVGWEEGYSH